jgi:hypothetical protein
VRQAQERRIIAAVLRCCPTRWRSRHGDEATVLASALLEDGTSRWSIAGSFLGGAAKERVFRRPSSRVGSALAAVTVGIAAVPLALFASLTPAGASSTDITIVISKPGDAARQLESAFAIHHFKIAVAERPVATDLVGSIVSVSTVGALSDNAGAISELHGRCNGGGSGCVDGLVLPLHYSGSARVTVGAATTSKDIHHPYLAKESRIQAPLATVPYHATLNRARTSGKKRV